MSRREALPIDASLPDVVTALARSGATLLMAPLRASAGPVADLRRMQAHASARVEARTRHNLAAARAAPDVKLVPAPPARAAAAS